METALRFRRLRSRVGSLATFSAGLGLVAGVLAAGPRGSTSPAELVATLGPLEKQERLGEILAHLTPDQREAYLFISWFGAAYDALGGGAAAESYRAIVAEHGLDEEWLSEDRTGRGRLRRVAAEALRRVDQAELLADLARFRKDHGRFGVAFGFAGRLRELHVEEDWAYARIGRSEFQMVRCEETWSWRPFEDLDR